MQDTPLKLSAEDAEDLTVIAACLQDAVTRMPDLAYQPKQRRFAAVFSRFKWEDQFGSTRRARPKWWVRSGIHFDGVLSARFRGLNQDSDQALELLTIEFEQGEDGSANILLDFAGGGAIQLDVECIDCHLTDLGRSWRGRRRPTHPSDER